MKIPRTIAPMRVIIVLRSLGYKLDPQKGNHIRLRHPMHTVTFLNQDPLEARTLRGIITEVSQHVFVPTHALSDQL
jgi:predicted RNA binding protein YcfA (HicA-like mRNA interferase family)